MLSILLLIIAFTGFVILYWMATNNDDYGPGVVLYQHNPLHHCDNPDCSAALDEMHVAPTMPDTDRKPC